MNAYDAVVALAAKYRDTGVLPVEALENIIDKYKPEIVAILEHLPEGTITMPTSTYIAIGDQVYIPATGERGQVLDANSTDPHLLIVASDSAPDGLEYRDDQLELYVREGEDGFLLSDEDLARKYPEGGRG